MPLVSTAHHLAELLTKTKVEQESDDEGSAGTAQVSWSTADLHRLLELTTKTEVKEERDDAALELDALIGLTTKTHAQQERDD